MLDSEGQDFDDKVHQELLKDISMLLTWHFGEIISNAEVLLKHDNLARPAKDPNNSLSLEIEFMSAYLMDKVQTEFRDGAKEVFFTLKNHEDFKTKLEAITTLKELKSFDEEMSSIISDQIVAKKQELEDHIKKYSYDFLQEFESIILAEHSSSFGSFYDSPEKLIDHKNFFFGRLDMQIVKGVLDAFKDSFGITDWEMTFFKKKADKLKATKPQNLTTEELAEYYLLMQANYLSSNVTVTLDGTLDPLSEQALVAIAATALDIVVTKLQANEQVTQETLLSAFVQATKSAVLPDAQDRPETQLSNQLEAKEETPQIPLKHVQNLTQSLAQLNNQYIENTITNAAHQVDQHHAQTHPNLANQTQAEAGQHLAQDFVQQHSGHIVETVIHGLQEGVHEALHAGHDAAIALEHKIEVGIHNVAHAVEHGAHNVVHAVEHGAHNVAHTFHDIKESLVGHMPHHGSHNATETPHAEVKKDHNASR